MLEGCVIYHYNSYLYIPLPGYMRVITVTAAVNEMVTQSSKCHLTDVRH